MLAYNSNRQRSVLELRQPTFKGRDHRACWPVEDAQHRIMRMCEMDYIQYGHSWSPICHSPREKELCYPSIAFHQVTRFLCIEKNWAFQELSDTGSVSQPLGPLLYLLKPTPKWPRHSDEWRLCMGSAMWASSPQGSSGHRHVTVPQGDQPVIQWQVNYIGSLPLWEEQHFFLLGIDSLNMDVPSPLSTLLLRSPCTDLPKTCHTITVFT